MSASTEHKHDDVRKPSMYRRTTDAFNENPLIAAPVAVAAGVGLYGGVKKGVSFLGEKLGRKTVETSTKETTKNFFGSLLRVGR